MIQVSQTHLPEAIFHDSNELPSRAHAAPMTVSAHKRENAMLDPSDDSNIPTADEEDSKMHHTHGLVPLSPTNSESSGSHSPTGGFGYGLPMAPSVHVIPPHESPVAPKPMQASPGYLNGYYTQSFVSDKGPAYWPHTNPVSQYGY
jgi:hypothetical protein